MVSPSLNELPSSLPPPGNHSESKRGCGFCFARSAYPAVLATSPAPHSACRQLHAMDGRLAEPSQYAPQYLLPFAAEQLHPGCAHFSIFFSAIETPWLLFQLPKSIRPATRKINPRQWPEKSPRLRQAKKHTRFC